jgi:hypothetical protein
MLDRLLNRLVSWSPLRFWMYAVLATLIAMEIVSWITSQVPPCIVIPTNYSANYGDNECPTQHVFFIKSLSQILETIGHNWITALSAAVAAIFTATIFWINRSQLKHSRAVDRAYISGGGNRDSEFVAMSAQNTPIYRPGNNFVFRINNYGKTHGTLYKLSYGFCNADRIPPEPVYMRQYLRSQIDPGRSGEPITAHPIPAEYARPVVYGRFHYKTIFGSHHSSGFIYRIIATEGSVAIRPPSDAYVEDRDEPPEDDDAT